MTDIVERLLWDAAHQRSDSETEKLERDAADEIERLRADADPAVCRMQFPDGSVPGNAREGAEGWKRWADEFQRRDREAADEIERLTAALERVLADIAEYERINNLAPNPGRQYCWDSVAHAHDVLRKP